LIEVKSNQIKSGEVSVPGSKSYTHRILIAAALSDGECTIANALKSEDTLLTLNALKQMGVSIEVQPGKILVQGTKGVLGACSEPVFLGNSGTSVRLLTAVASLGKAVYILTGTERMKERPIQDLLDGLAQIGVNARSLNGDGCPPVEIRGGGVRGGSVTLDCAVSSQFLSALLLIAPYTSEGLEIIVSRGPVSRPYVDITVAVMDRFGVEVAREGYAHFGVKPGRIYRGGDYTVEPDCSQAGYFWAAAAVTGAAVKVRGISRDSLQGDLRFTDCLEAMGCRIIDDADGIEVIGAPLKAIDVDMGDMPDMVPTLAVVAAFASGVTVIKNVAHLKAKESDRLAAVCQELSRMGIETKEIASGLVIKGGLPRGAEIETYGDHRIAMSFAVAGLKTPGVSIRDETCVDKSFPDFWRVLEGLYR
jgi:3-phosphoshikimate 1-carboxyvinyltransferase